MKYELWEHAGGHTFFEVPPDEPRYRARIRQLKAEAPLSELTWTVQAESWNAAMQLLYDRKGWGRFRTLEEDLGESIDIAGPAVDETAR